MKRILKCIGLAIFCLSNAECGTIHHGPPPILTRSVPETLFEEEPFMAEVAVNFNYDHFFTQRLFLEIAERTNFDGQGARLSDNFRIARTIDPSELSRNLEEGGSSRVAISAGGIVKLRLSTFQVDGKLIHTDGSKRLEAALRQGENLGAELAQSPDGLPNLRGLGTQKGTLLWAIRSPLSPYPDRWQPGESMPGLANWLLSSRTTEVMIWRDSDPSRVQLMTISPKLPEFSDTLHGKIDPSTRQVTLWGWNKGAWTHDTLYVFDLGSRRESTVASVRGSVSSVNFVQDSTVGAGRYAIAAKQAKNGAWTRLSNVVDLCIPAAPGPVYLSLSQPSQARVTMDVRWIDQSDNEESFQVERQELQNAKGTGEWVAVGREYEGAEQKGSAAGMRVVKDNQWHEEYAWRTFTGYGIQYRVRSARFMGDALLTSDWVYSEPLIKSVGGR